MNKQIKSCELCIKIDVSLPTGPQYKLNTGVYLNGLDNFRMLIAKWTYQDEFHEMLIVYVVTT